MPDDIVAPSTETLPAQWYHDEAIFQRERRAIFARNWWLVARMDQVPGPGDFVADEVAGYPVFVVRDRAGALKGFHNVCRHRAGPVVRAATGRCDVLRCAYHGWLYDLEGRLRKAPGFASSADFDPADFGLLPVRVESWNGLIFVCLDDGSPDLAAWLGDVVAIAADFPPLSEMTLFIADEIEGAANWKTYGDNSAEGYHLPFVHSALNKAVVKEETEIKAYENGNFVGFDVRYRVPETGGTRRGFWVYKYPGLLLHFSEAGFNLERVTPLGPRRLRLNRWFWFPEAMPGGSETKDRIVAESSVVMREDLGICEAVQRNLEAGAYHTGRLSPERETGTLFFQSLVRRALADGG